MIREGLTAGGLVKESLVFHKDQKQFEDDLTWFGDRQRDTHDLFHVLREYGRDGLVAAALLAFTFGQSRGLGIRFISYITFREIHKILDRSLDLKTVSREAPTNGRIALKIIDEDKMAILPLPLDEVRARLIIRKPSAYKAALRAYANLSREHRDLFVA